MLNSWTASFLACAPPWKRAGAFAAAYCSEQRGLASPLHVCVCLITLDAHQSLLLQLYLDPTQRLRRQWFGCCDLQLIPWLLNFMQSHLRSIKLHTQSVFQKGVCLSAKTGERENPLSVYSPWELASCSPLKLRLPEFLASASTSCLLKNLSHSTGRPFIFLYHPCCMGMLQSVITSTSVKFLAHCMVDPCKPFPER